MRPRKRRPGPRQLPFAEKEHELLPVQANEIARRVIDAFPQSRAGQVNRARRAAILIFIAEHPGATTEQLARKMHMYNYEVKRAQRLSQMFRFLHELEGRGLVTRTLHQRFVPPSASTYGPGLGKMVGEHSARWYLAADVLGEEVCVSSS